jgi:hypothetical protein
MLQDTRRACPYRWYSVQVLPLGADLHIRLVEAEGGAAHLQIRTHPLINLRRVTLYPPPHYRVIHRVSAFAHHLLEIAIGETVVAVPTDAQKNDRRLEMTPLERGLLVLQRYASRSMIA